MTEGSERNLASLVEERDTTGNIASVIYWGDNLNVLKRFPSNSIDLIYLDPPFSPNREYWDIWGEDEKGKDEAVIEAYNEACRGGRQTYVDWIEERARLMHRVLKETGSFYFHCDPQLGHYFKAMLDNIFKNSDFGYDKFRNEIVWCYSGGGIPTEDLPRKHDTIFRYVKNPDSNYTFNVQYRPYTEGTLQRGRTKIKGKYAKLRAEGTPITDWWTDVPKITSPTDKEKTGYATQKSVALLERIVRISSNPGDVVLDPFCGCGTTIVATQNLNRKWIGMDIAEKGCKTSGKRLAELDTPYSIIPWDLNERQLKELKVLSGNEFQSWVLLRIGGQRRRGADRGIDLYTSTLEPVQVKKPKVGPAVLRDFRTALQRERKNKGYIVGFDFTGGAVEESNRYKAKESLEIKLVRVEELDEVFNPI